MSSAYGYGQFTDATWGGMVREYGEKYGIKDASKLTDVQANSSDLRNNTALQAGMLAEFTRENVAKGAELDGPNADANVYAMHNLGGTAGPKFLNALRDKPNERVDAVLSKKVIARNPGLYGDGSGSIASTYQLMGEQLGRYEKYADDVKQALPAQTVQSPQAITHPTQSHQSSSSHAANILHYGSRGEAVGVIQQQLRDLGYTDSRGNLIKVDNDYGHTTQAAVKAFQTEHGLTPDGRFGHDAQGKLDTAVQDREALKRNLQIPDFNKSVSTLHDFSDPSHPQNALYNTLKDGFPPNAPPEFLAQATAACYMSGIKQPDDLGNVFGKNGQVVFESRAAELPRNATLDTTQSTPSVQQTMQNVQNFDQNQAQMQNQINAQIAQHNTQGPQWPGMGGPGR